MCKRRGKLLGREVAYRLSCSLWERHDRTKAYLSLDGRVMLADITAQGAPEQELADRMLSASGPDESSQVQPAGGGDRSPFDVGGKYGPRQRLAFLLGPMVFGLIYLWPTPTGLAPEGQVAAAVTAWVAVWWVGEAIPIPATSLLPLVLFPLTGTLPMTAVAPAYADPLIFLFMGGFFLAMAMQRWGLHRRIALRTIRAAGTDPAHLIFGFMIATAFLSMWVSNTATVMMMVPIALAVIHQTADRIEELDLDIETDEGAFSFGVALMLCIAYAASVGGVGTLIGTPPNVLFAGQAGSLFDVEITFLQWMLYGVPIAIVGLIAVYVYVTKIAITPEFSRLPIGEETIETDLAQIGPMSRQERWVLVVFVGMAGSWVGASLIGQAGIVTVPGNVDAIIAITGALILFSIPTKTADGEATFLLNWTSGVKIPWGVILLFGGGLAIAAAFGETGLADWIGSHLEGFRDVPLVLILLVVVTLTVFLTEVTSNTATTAMLMPILAGVAIGISVHPLGLMIAAATAASFAFMLPVATPPNAVVFGSGYITIPQMARVGIGLNLIGIMLITAVALGWLPIAWGIDVTSVPPELLEGWAP